VLSPASARAYATDLVRLTPLAFSQSCARPWQRPPRPARSRQIPDHPFPRKTQPYETVRSLFNRPDLRRSGLHASHRLATVIHMAIEGLGVASFPMRSSKPSWRTDACARSETDMKIPPLTFSASWLPRPKGVGLERVADLPPKIAQKAARLTEPARASWNGGRVQGSDRMSRAASTCRSIPPASGTPSTKTAQFGATPKGGVRRLTLGPEDSWCADWFRKLLRGGRLEFMSMRWTRCSACARAADMSKAPVGLGRSHLDTQPTGGKIRRRARHACRA